MTTKPIQVAFVENVITNYRVDFFERLARYEDFEITVFCSDAKGVPKLKIVENVSGSVSYTHLTLPTICSV